MAQNTIYSQVLGGLVQNIIVLNDASLIPIFSQGYDSLNDITNIIPQPGPGWSYDGKNYIAPPPSVPQEEIVEGQVVAGNMNTQQRDSLSPDSGMTIFNTDTNKEQYYDGTKWIDIN